MARNTKSATNALIPVNAQMLALGPGSLGSIDAYIQAVNRVPLLTPDEELRLARDLRQDDDLEAAGRLVMSHLRLVVAVARNYLGYGLPHADLIQEGNIGLMKAVKRFDPERGVRLVSFALHWIKAEIHEFILRNWRLVKARDDQGAAQAVFQPAQHEAGARHDDAGRDRRTSRANSTCKPEEVSEMETRLSGGDMALEGRIEDGEEEFAPIAYLADAGSEPTQVLQRREHDLLQTDGVREAMEDLDPRSRRIVEARWLDEDADGRVGTATLHELAARIRGVCGTNSSDRGQSPAEDAYARSRSTLEWRCYQRTVAWLVG